MTQSGVTILECLISLSLGLILTSLMFKGYIGAHGSLTEQANIVQVEDALVNSMDIIVREIEQAGYIGCAKLTINFPIVNYLEYRVNIDNKLILSDNFLVSRHAAFNPAYLINKSGHSKELYVTDNHLYQPGNILIISDCKHAEIFKIKRVYHIKGLQKIEPVRVLQSDFNKNAEIALFEINKLFIRMPPAKRSNQHVGLYLEDIHHSIKPLQDGVSGLKFQSYHLLQQLKGVGFTVDYNLNNYSKNWYGYVSVI